MSTRTTPLDERYGRTPTQRRRGRIGAVAAAALVLVMLFRPAGLLPSAVRKRELAERAA